MKSKRGTQQMKRRRRIEVSFHHSPLCSPLSMPSMITLNMSHCLIEAVNYLHYYILCKRFCLFLFINKIRGIRCIKGPVSSSRRRRRRKTQKMKRRISLRYFPIMYYCLLIVSLGKIMTVSVQSTSLDGG